MCRVTAGQNQSAGHEYECDGVFHSMVFCLMCDFGLTSTAQAQPPGGQASNGMMMSKFHFPVKTEGAVAVGASAVLGILDSSWKCDKLGW